MINGHCPVCQRQSGFKRSLGFGTFFGVVITLGWWLLVLPFYPKRCIGCGAKWSDAKESAWREAKKTGASSDYIELSASSAMQAVTQNPSTKKASEFMLFRRMILANPKNLRDLPESFLKRLLYVSVLCAFLLFGLFSAGVSLAYSIAWFSPYLLISSLFIFFATRLIGEALILLLRLTEAPQPKTTPPLPHRR